MNVVEDVLWAEAKICDLPVVELFNIVSFLVYSFNFDQFCFKELWDVEDEGQSKSWKDVGQEVNFEGVLITACEVLDGVADCQISFFRYAHYQEGLEDQEHILEWVPDVGHHHDIDLIFKVYLKPLKVDQDGDG